MIRHRFIVFLLFILPMYWSFDGFLISTIQIQPNFGTIDCTSLKLTINNQTNIVPQCELGNQLFDHSYVTLTYNGTEPMTDLKNSTIVLEALILYHDATDYNKIVKNSTETYSGYFLFDDKSAANKLSVGYVTLNLVPPPKPTTKSTAEETGEEKSTVDREYIVLAINTNDTAPSSASLTIKYVRVSYDDSKPANTHGGAVAVAIIEGIALIAILAYMGYRTMVKHKMKQTTMNAAMYGYDNNSRITVPDSIRMNDIPPPRDPTYATPPTPTVQQQTPTRNTVMTTQELVVPSQTLTPTTPTTTTTTTNQQFRDPFDTLENW